MNILFLHRDFPAQFKYLALALANNPANNVIFITENDTLDIKGITKYVFKIPKKSSGIINPYLTFYDEVLEYSKAALEKAKEIKAQGIKPDVIYGFAFWGLNMFMKDVFPDVPVISYYEWFYNIEGADIGFDGQKFSEEEKAQMRCKNSHLLMDLYSNDAGISPTYWQKNQFPKEFHDKIQVIHDGIDTETCKPDDDAVFLIQDEGLKLSRKDKVITYGTRGMEPYRGFIQFMQAVEILLKKRPDAHVVIAGVDDVYYGPKPKDYTYKEYVLKNLNLDMKRVHFTGGLSFVDYIKMLQISSVHVYSTFPYILSWSILNAMSAGCCLVASNTAPVLEVVQDNYNGLLFDFYNINQLVQKVEYALDNQDKMTQIRTNARQTVIDKYDVRKLLMQQINFINNIILQYRG